MLRKHAERVEKGESTTAPLSEEKSTLLGWAVKSIASHSASALGMGGAHVAEVRRVSSHSIALPPTALRALRVFTGSST
eukprot:4416807-Pyramimonas_sp.AAC.2